MRQILPFLLLCVFSIYFTPHLFAQTWNLSTGTVTNLCSSGTFLDPGGNGNYSNSSNVTGTICPSTPGNCVSVQFNSFTLESTYDFLNIYDGNSTSAPQIGSFSGSTAPSVCGGGGVMATNASGCLTFRFTSDGSVTYAGWNATITCIPCGTNPNPNPDPVDCLSAIPVCSDAVLNNNSNGDGCDDFIGTNNTS
ncbi:MAG: CUB domain-containing protein, partial [Saprospiraceae bacterium]